MRLRALVGGLLFSIGGTTGAVAEPPQLGLPVACQVNVDCFVQQFFDVDPGPGSRDFRCNALSYQGHSGTDFRVRDREMMRQGVQILAAAGGRVVGTRDGVPDKAIETEADRTAVKGRECGNGLAIDHGNGWRTQYCHMRNGSVQVRKGQPVRKGDPLGLVGLSGKTQFPHLHLSVFHNNKEVDPYRGLSPAKDCGGQYQSLWDASTAQVVAYRPGGIINVGLTGNPKLSFNDVKEGRASVSTIDAKAPALVAWAFTFGRQKGEIIRAEITAPDGSRFFLGESEPAAKDQILAYRLLGRRNRTPLAAGTYTAVIEIIRNGQRYDAWQTGVIVR